MHFARRLYSHGLVWPLAAVCVSTTVLFTPVAAYIWSDQGQGPIVNATIVFFVGCLVWLGKRQSDIISAYRTESSRQHTAMSQVLYTTLRLTDPAKRADFEAVSEMMIVVARQVGLGKNQLRDLLLAASVHDVGKIGVVEGLLAKSGPLSTEEWDEMKKHPTKAYDVLKGIDFLKGAAEILYCHHERVDGKGYPQGLSGEEIPLAARIYAVVDAYDALTSERPYRRARTPQEATDEIFRCSGRQFDPRVVNAFLQAHRQGLLPGRGRNPSDRTGVRATSKAPVRLATNGDSNALIVS